VGVNTSPHLSEFTERIQINGQQISKEDVIKYANLLQEIRERVNSETEFGYATYFEVVSAMALQYFADNNVDYVILEVGLGGTYDATNVVTPIATVITDISLDHTEHLGNTLTSVAENKAGIIKPGIPVITSNTNSEVVEVIMNACRTNNSQLYMFGSDFRVDILESSTNGLKFNYSGINFNYQDLTIPLLGAHQMVNAGIAVGVLDILSMNNILKVTEHAIRDGLRNTQWPGRLEVLQYNPIVLLDGAHNPAGAEALAKALELFDYKNLHLVFGCSEEKDIKNLLDGLIPLAEKIFITKANIRRAADPELILEEIKDYNVNKIAVTPVKAAVKNALSEAAEDDLVCICGSLFIVGEARELWSSGLGETKNEKIHRIHY
jgi:dihydrofolate synthase/folylpolyglutamate synthase